MKTIIILISLLFVMPVWAERVKVPACGEDCVYDGWATCYCNRKPTVDVKYRTSPTKHHYTLTKDQFVTALRMYLEAHHYKVPFGKWTFGMSDWDVGYRVYTKPEDRTLRITVEERQHGNKNSN